MKKILGIILGLLLVLGGIGSAKAVDKIFMLPMGGPNWSAFAPPYIQVSDDFWIGLGAAKCRVEFDDQTIDEFNLLDCNVGINTSTPAGILHTVLAAGRPAIFGGDALATVTGVSGTDVSPTVLTVATTNGVAIGDAVIINSGTNATVGTYWVTAVAVDTTVTLDRNANSGGAISAASVTYVNDPLIIESGSGSGEPRIVLPSGIGSGFAFGDADTQIYESSDDNIDVATAGATRFRFGSSGHFFHASGTKYGLLGVNAATATMPNILPNYADQDTGLGRATVDVLSLIAGGVEAQGLTEASRTIESNASVCQDNSGVELKTVAAHGLAVDDVVQVAAGTGALCGGLSASTNYYVLAVGSTTTATLSASRGGSIVAYSSTGSAFTSYNLEITVNIYGDVVTPDRIFKSTLVSGVFTIDVIGAVTVIAPSATAGTNVELNLKGLTYTFTDDSGSSDLTNLGFGIVETVHWAEDMPFFIYLVNEDDTAANAGMFISRDPTLGVTPAANYIHDTDAAAANDTQDSIFGMWADDAGKAAKPVILIGVIRMQWSTTSDDWTVQTLGNNDGIGQDRLAKTFATTWTMADSQNGANVVTDNYIKSAAGTTPVWATPANTIYTYELSADGKCTIWFTTIVAGNATNGDGANNISLSLPYIAVRGGLTAGVIIGTIATTPNSSLVLVLTAGSEVGLLATEANSAVNANEFSDAGDDLRAELTYKAF